MTAGSASPRSGILPAALSVDFLLSDFPSPPSFIPPSPSPLPSPSPSSSSSNALNPPPSLPPSGPLPPVPGPSPLSTHTHDLIMMPATRSSTRRRASKISVLTTTSSSWRDSTATSSSSNLPSPSTSSHTFGTPSRVRSESLTSLSSASPSLSFSLSTSSSSISTSTPTTSTSSTSLCAPPSRLHSRMASSSSLSSSTDREQAHSPLAGPTIFESDELLGLDVVPVLARTDLSDLPRSSPSPMPIPFPFPTRGGADNDALSAVDMHDLPRDDEDDVVGVGTARGSGEGIRVNGNEEEELDLHAQAQALHLQMRASRSKSALHKSRIAATPALTSAPSLRHRLAGELHSSLAQSQSPSPSLSQVSSLSQAQAQPRPAPSLASPAHRSPSPDIATMIATTPRPHPHSRTSTSTRARRSSGSGSGSSSSRAARSRVVSVASSSGTGVGAGVGGGGALSRKSSTVSRSSLPYVGDDWSEQSFLDDYVGDDGYGDGDGAVFDEEGGRGYVEGAGGDGEMDVDVDAGDSDLDLHTPLPNLMVKHGMLSPNSKLFALSRAGTPASTFDGRPGSTLSLSSTATKSGVYKDDRDTVERRVRHRDGRLLRGGIGLTTGLGWSDSEDEDKPSALTRRLSSLSLDRRTSSASLSLDRRISSTSLSGDRRTSSASLGSTPIKAARSKPKGRASDGVLARSQSAGTVVSRSGGGSVGGGGSNGGIGLRPRSRSRSRSRGAPSAWQSSTYPPSPASRPTSEHIPESESTPARLVRNSEPAPVLESEPATLDESELATESEVSPTARRPRRSGGREKSLPPLPRLSRGASLRREPSMVSVSATTPTSASALRREPSSASLRREPSSAALRREPSSTALRREPSTSALRAPTAKYTPSLSLPLSTSSAGGSDRASPLRRQPSSSGLRPPGLKYDRTPSTASPSALSTPTSASTSTLSMSSGESPPLRTSRSMPITPTTPTTPFSAPRPLLTAAALQPGEPATKSLLGYNRNLHDAQRARYNSGLARKPSLGAASAAAAASSGPAADGERPKPRIGAGMVYKKSNSGALSLSVNTAGSRGASSLPSPTPSYTGAIAI